MNSFLSTVPFDLYQLALFHLVVRNRSFTKAAEIAGLTQSAITRQMQGMENSLSLQLLERTTRQVRMTPAGEFLYGESSRLLGDVDRTLQHLFREFAGARPEVRVSVSRTIGHAYLPGFFHANLKRLPRVGYCVSCLPSNDIIGALEANEQDIGVFCPPKLLPKTLRVTHRFEDAFILIVPKSMESSLPPISKKAERMEFIKSQNWLMIGEESNTGLQLRRWMKRHGLDIEPAMELDNFDLIINLVTLGLGVGFVPIRALAPYNAKGKLVRFSLLLPEKFTREIVVVARKHRKMPVHLNQFIEHILF